MPVPTNIDQSFILKVEGEEFTTYIPTTTDPNTGNKIPIDQSGVTIGRGLDLGQYSAKELTQIGLDPVVFQKLVQFAGKKGMAAQKIHQHVGKVTIDSTAMQQINDFAIKNIVSKLQTHWKNAKTGVKFEDLPTEAATALVSVAYQHGASTPTTSYPTFWKHMTQQDWGQAEQELRNFYRDPQTKQLLPNHHFQSRRSQEADLLQHLQRGTTPQGGTGQRPHGYSVYTIQPGDTFSEIGQRHQIPMADLQSRNPHIQNPNRIHPGQKLHVGPPRFHPQLQTGPAIRTYEEVFPMATLMFHFQQWVQNTGDAFDLWQS